MKKNDWSSHDVYWYSPKYKKPIAYSTVADSDAISLINQPNHTAIELMKILKSRKYIVSQDIIKVVQAFIDKGLGSEMIKTSNY